MLQRDGVESAERRFGYSVAISDDAQWVVVNSPGNGFNVDPLLQGAMIYQRTGPGTYIIQRPLLTPPETTLTHSFTSVALSGNGRTLAMTSSSMVVVFDRDASGLWVRVPGTLPVATATVNPVLRPTELSSDGAEMIVCSNGTVSFYSRPVGSAPGTPFSAGPSFAPGAGETGQSNIAVSADGAMCATLLRPSSGVSRMQVYRKAGGAWSAAESIPLTVLLTSSTANFAMSGDGETFLVRSGPSTYWLERTAGTWFQMNTAFFNLPGGGGNASPSTIALSHDGAYAYVVHNSPTGLAATASIARPQPNNSWTFTGGVEVPFPYPSPSFRPSNGQALDMTPDGRFAVVGLPGSSLADGNNTIFLADFGCASVLDLRPPATIVMQPTGQAVGVGGEASFTFAVNSEVTPQFQWRRNGVNIANGPSGTGSTYSGTQSAVLTVSNVQSGDQFAILDCTVTNACSNLVSVQAVLSVQTGGGTGGVCVADLGVAGGEFGHDGLLDNNDFIAFINAFFDQTGCQ